MLETTSRTAGFGENANEMNNMLFMEWFDSLKVVDGGYGLAIKEFKVKHEIFRARDDINSLVKQ